MDKLRLVEIYDMLEELWECVSPYPGEELRVGRIKSEIAELEAHLKNCHYELCQAHARVAELEARLNDYRLVAACNQVRIRELVAKVEDLR